MMFEHHAMEVSNTVMMTVLLTSVECALQIEYAARTEGRLAESGPPAPDGVALDSISNFCAQIHETVLPCDVAPSSRCKC